MPNKAVAAGVAGAVTVILCWAVETFAKVSIPSEVASSITTLIATAATYFTPHGGQG